MPISSWVQAYYYFLLHAEKAIEHLYKEIFAVKKKSYTFVLRFEAEEVKVLKVPKSMCRGARLKSVRFRKMFFDLL